jgi:Protein phosphatase 2C
MITAQPDVSVTDLQPTDEFFILGCDGIWDCLSCQEAVRRCILQFCAALHCAVLYCTVLYCTVLCHSKHHSTSYILYSTVHHSGPLHHTILHTPPRIILQCIPRLITISLTFPWFSVRLSVFETPRRTSSDENYR